MNITGFSHRHPRAILFIVSVLAGAGVLAALNLPISIFPDITFPRIVILVDYGDQPADRVMVTLTKPLEEAANSVPGVRTVRSTTARGAAEIFVNFNWGTDIILSQQLLQARVSSIRSQLPPAASINVERMNATFFPIVGYALTSDKRSLVDMRDVALYTIRPALSRIFGVSQTRIVGGRTREFLVTADPAKLSAYNLDITQVSAALQKSNLLGSVGLIDANYRLYLTLVDNRQVSIEAVRAIVVGTRGSTPILLGQLAAVTPSEKDEYIRVTSDGKEAVLINILKQPDGNTAQISNDVKTTLADLRSQIPSDVRVSNFYDQSDIIQESFATVRDSIGMGVLLAVLILLVFLKNWRVILVAAVIIPITVAITALLLHTVKESFNIMTLGGIAAAIGLIIDDTIVVVENIFRHFEERRESFLSAVHSSVSEMIPAVVGSSAATIVIHIPFAFLSGVAGSFFKSLSLTMIFALLVSFAVSLLVAPLLASRFKIRESVTPETVATRKKGGLLPLYQSALTGLLKRRILIIPLTLILLGSSAYFYTQLGSSFMPVMDEGAFVLDYWSPPGTSLNETHRVLLELEEMIMETPEVESYSRRTGTQMGFFITEPNTGDFLIKLKAKRNRSAEQIMDELRSQIEASQPALRIEFGEAIQDLVGDLTNVPSPIEIKVFGPDKPLIEKTAKDIAGIIATVPGVVDAFNGITISGPALIIVPDEPAIGRAGLTVEDLIQQLENDIRGSVATEIQSGEKLIGVRVRLPDRYREDQSRLLALRIGSPNGGIFQLGALASIKIDPGQTEIARENLKPMVAVTSRISGRDLGSTIAEIQNRLKRELTVPQGVTLSYGGIYETQQESFRGLLMVLIAASLFVWIVLLIEFESFYITGVIYLLTILSLFGVFFALWATQTTFNVSSFVGMILIVGAVAENCIFYVHFARKYRNEGLENTDALLAAGALRLRPIIMTALATILTLFPLALGVGAGAQMQRPLAIAVIGGFAMSTILTLFALPMMLSFRKPGK
ncbi:MAG TPA: efflux RND transporter permease subunit [Bacteroidota bacterium]|nr:efflux RND transporter permease subunit [Bacteroidota bacterium]